MQLATLTSLLVSMAIPQTGAAPTVQQNGLIPLAESLKSVHPEAYAAFMSAPFINLDPATTAKRQAVTVGGTPNGTRPSVTPENIFVLQCSDAGFRGKCLSWGAPPGKCVNYSNFNKTQAFLDKYENQTSSLSTNTGGLCQFYKFTDCDNEGDDPGVTLSYNYNLGEASDGYSGDYDDQIRSWRC